MDISACNNNAQWPSACFCEQVDFCSKFITTGRVSSGSCSTETGLTHSSISNLPLSVDSSKLSTFHDQNQPKSLENAVLAAPLEPLLQPPTRNTVTARLFRRPIPLNCASHSIDVRVEDCAKTAPGAANSSSHIGTMRNVKHAQPRRLWNLPYRGKFFALRSRCHARLLDSALDRIRLGMLCS